MIRGLVLLAYVAAKFRRYVPGPHGPRRIGWAINTRDGVGLARASEAIESWGADALRQNATTGILIFSDTVHEDWAPRIKVRPCCDEHLGTSIVDAQRKREHTWHKMLTGLPSDTWCDRP